MAGRSIAHNGRAPDRLNRWFGALMMKDHFLTKQLKMKLGTIIYVKRSVFDRIHAASDKWAEFCKELLYDERFPRLLGGLDHVTQTKKQITFHDIGVNYRDNTFTIRPKQ